MDQSVCLAIPQTVSPVTSLQQDPMSAIVHMHAEPRIVFSKTYKIIMPMLSLWKWLGSTFDVDL